MKAPKLTGYTGGPAVDPVANLLGRLDGVHQLSDTQWMARCPAHDDRNPSLSVGRTVGGNVLINCHAGCKTGAILAALGLESHDLYCESARPVAHVDSNGADRAACPYRRTYGTPDEAAASLAERNGKRVGTWLYQDVGGTPVLSVLRFDKATGKTFRPVRPVDGGWQIGDPKGPLPLYRLPQISTQSPVYVGEGEKVADAAVSIGLPATTSAHGAKSAKKTDWGPLAGKDVVVFPDNDDPGRGYSQTVVDILQRLDPPARVKIVELPDLPPHGDLVDFLGQREGQPAESIRQDIQTLVDSATWAELPGAEDQADAAPERDAAGRLILRGVKVDRTYSSTMQNVVEAFRRGLTESTHVFIYGLDVVLDVDDGERCLVQLCVGHQLTRAATALLANLLVCHAQQGGGHGAPPREIEFAPPRSLVDIGLNDAATRAALPRIRLYARRPVFDRDFRYHGPGWHPDVGILVHGPDVVPMLPGPTDLNQPALNRLPPHLQELLRDFCFYEDADLANAVAMLLTGMLSSVFIEAGKPIALLDGNQPGVGKTLLARVFGLILDGAEPQLTAFTTDDSELGKRICATLRGSKQTVVIVDNAKVVGGTAIQSITLEKLTTEATVVFRVLGHSRNLVRPNDLIYIATMNGTKTSRDLVSRGVAIRLHHDGAPENRGFAGRDPLRYARQHRIEVLGELAGMVEHWRSCGRPSGARRHRFVDWAAVLGGILAANGLPEFLANMQEASAHFDASLDELSALAEAAVGSVRSGEPEPVSTKPRTAAEWEPVFETAMVLVEEREHARSKRARATLLGRWLAVHVDRGVPIDVPGRCGRATLRRREERSRKRVFWFAVQWDGSARADAERDDRRPMETAICRERSVDRGETAHVGGGNSEAW